MHGSEPLAGFSFFITTCIVSLSLGLASPLKAKQSKSNCIESFSVGHSVPQSAPPLLPSGRMREGNPAQGAAGLPLFLGLRGWHEISVYLHILRIFRRLVACAMHCIFPANVVCCRAGFAHHHHPPLSCSLVLLSIFGCAIIPTPSRVCSQGVFHCY